MKVDSFLTRTDSDTMSRFNLGDPQTILHRTLPFLEIAARITIRHGGILVGSGTGDYTKGDWTTLMAKVLETSSIYD